MNGYVVVGWTRADYILLQAVCLGTAYSLPTGGIIYPHTLLTGQFPVREPYPYLWGAGYKSQHSRQEGDHQKRRLYPDKCKNSRIVPALEHYPLFEYAQCV